MKILQFYINGFIKIPLEIASVKRILTDIGTSNQLENLGVSDVPSPALHVEIGYDMTLEV